MPLPAGGEAMLQRQSPLPLAETEDLAEQQHHDYPAEQRLVALVAEGARAASKSAVGAIRVAGALAEASQKQASVASQITDESALEGEITTLRQPCRRGSVDGGSCSAQHGGGRGKP